MLSLILLCSSLIGCAPRHLRPEITSDGVLFPFYAPTAKSVTITGSFNEWDLQKNRLTGPDNHGVWTIILPLPQGRYEYLFVINEKDWQPDPSVPTVDDGFGGKNSVLLVSEGPSGL